MLSVRGGADKCGCTVLCLVWLFYMIMKMWMLLGRKSELWFVQGAVGSVRN